ncbi:threonine/serine exporter family protein [Clostridium sp.]|uniref:threonine/serine exporter family protein n=1 Tax=Clostridium sp. TaxID=1506 RepID=UPI003F3CEE7F
MDMDELLHVATFAGKIMLESGAETYRAEEIIWRICKIYGAEEADSFVTTTGIMVSIYDAGKTYSLIKRVSVRTVDLDKVDKVNDLSRNILSKNLSISDLKKELLIINNGNRYSITTNVLISALGAFCFVFLFDGAIKDAISAFFIGIVIKITSIKFSNLNINTFFINSICAGIAAIMAIFFTSLGIATNLDKTIIGSIMLLVPGLSITNAIRDTISGDLLAGLTRAAEAFLVAISIAVGTGAVLSFWISNFGGI